MVSDEKKDKKAAWFSTDGTVHPDFQHVEKVFKQNYYMELENQGSAFAVYHKGELVVDLWGGLADKNSGREWNRDTMTVAFSSTKAVTALCAAVLVDREILDFDALVTKYWPEYALNGKDKTTVSMLVNHQAGLAALDQPILKEEVKTHWQDLGKKFEEQKPNWTPGDTIGYHAITYGWLVDQLVRRTDEKERSLGRFFREEIANPQKIEFYIGLPMYQYYRVARHVLPNSWPNWATIKANTQFAFNFEGRKLTAQIFRNPSWLYPTYVTGSVLNDPEIQALENGSMMGIGTARSLAKFFSLSLDGTLLTKESTLATISQPTMENVSDKVLGVNFGKNRGHGFFHTKSPTGSWQFGHPGYGGQNVKADPDNQLAFAYLTNGLSTELGEQSRIFTNLQTAVYKSLAEINQ